MITTQSNKIKKLKHLSHLENNLNNINDIEKVMNDIDIYFQNLESTVYTELTNKDLKKLSKLQKELLSILLNVKYLMKHIETYDNSGPRIISF